MTEYDELTFGGKNEDGTLTLVGIKPVEVVEVAEEAKAEPSPAEMPFGVESINARLEQVLARAEMYKAKGFKKLPAKQTLQDIQFMIFIVKILTSVNEDLKLMVKEFQSRQTGIVGADGKPLIADLASSLIIA